ncbi:conserved hypothetical protein [Histoplasma capsulatum var. duboisii H88]|uniref:FluG domain-containing protein n=2 Tax=Ajellomyces capsulatus (strain H88) TaxID=544711 RepID=F0UJD5_AJEC8|nr:conserved hypothetical protein [Histoplasma capsulatum var. duboisii H88]
MAPPKLQAKDVDRYCIQSNEDYVDYLLLEDHAIYMNFFDWMSKTSREKTLQSYDQYWRRLCQYFELFAHRSVNDDVHKQMRRGHAFQSDLPKYVSAKDLPDSVCYRDIELFYLKDPQSKHDVLCAVIEFRNLKDRPEGADGTKFFMHSDYQLAYCPIAQIISFAFQDGAFANTKLTPELIWRLRVPKRSSSLALRWKPEVLNMPLLRRLEHTPYGYKLHGSLPMTYQSSREALRELGRDARFEDDIGHYNFRRWAANEVNRNFTSQERQRVLGQSGDAVFEKHYQSQFIARDLQHVILLRPSQDSLLHVTGSMLRKRDPLAPSDLTDAHKRAICQHPEILQLMREKRELMAEMHEAVKKDLAKPQKTLATDTRERARKDYFQNAPVLEINRQINQLLGESDVGSDADSSADEDWELPIPSYVFFERARLAENFYGPDAENFEEDKLLAHRIQVTKDMVALLGLCEPSRRGNRVNWDLDNDEFPEQPEEPSLPEEDSLVCPTDVCIICCGVSRRSASNPPPHKFPPKRKDSLRRHLIESHLVHAHDGISCNWEACRNVPKFTEITEFLAHASEVHKYDVNIKLCHLPQRPQLPCSDTSSVESREVSLESENGQGTITPASSVEFEMANIDPRLMEQRPVTKPSPCWSGTENSASFAGSDMATIDPRGTELPTRRSRRGAAKAAKSEPGPPPERATRSSRNCDPQQEQCGQKEGEKRCLGRRKASDTKPPLRRSKRLKSNDPQV